MEKISQVDIDKAIEVLKDNLLFEVANRIATAEIIPKLYAETYIEALNIKLKEINDNESLQDLSAEIPQYQLDSIIRANTKLSAVKAVITNALERKGQFCDFNDSMFNDKTKIGKCECDQHSDNINHRLVLDESEQKEFDKIMYTEGYFEAYAKFESKLNPDNQELKPVYMPDEDTHKWKDDPYWYCKTCYDSLDGGDGEFDVSCDMEMAE